VPGRVWRARGRARAWEGGPQGRSVLDRICAEAPARLTPNGTLLLVHSALCGADITLAALRDARMKALVIARRHIPFGPVMRARAAWLEDRGLIIPGQRHEELVVIRADRT
jgi:release factor glutamine methyltransferase